MGVVSDRLGGTGGAKKPTTSSTSRIPSKAPASGGGVVAARLSGTPVAGTSSGKGGGKNENFLMKGLNFLDKGRAAVVSTVAEVGDAAAGRGFSVKDIGENIGRNMTVSDILNEESATANMPGWAKFGLGFLGDVVMDPLTYAGGAGVLKGSAQSVARTALKPGVVEALAKNVGQEAAQKLTREAAETALSRGVSNINPEVLKVMGQVTGKSSTPGLYMAGKHIPKTEGLSRTLSSANATTRKAFLNTKVGEEVSRRLGGRAGQAFTAGAEAGNLLKRMRNGGPDAVVAFNELENMKLLRRTQNVAEGQMLKSLDEVLKPFKGQENLTNLRRSLEGDELAHRALSLVPDADGTLADRVAAVRGWLDEAGARVGMPKIENYFPRTWSKELREELQKSVRSGSKEIGPAMKRELKDGTEFLGETLRGTPAQIRDQIEDALRAQHGSNYKKMFSDDVTEVLSGYARQIARREARMAAEEGLVQSVGEIAAKGNVARTGKGAARKRVAANQRWQGKAARAGESLGRAEARVARAQAGLDKVETWARQVAKQNIKPLDRQIAKLDKEVSMLEDHLTKLMRKGEAYSDPAIEARVNRLHEQRRVLEERKIVTEQVVESAGSAARLTFDSAEAALGRAQGRVAATALPPPQEIVQRVKRQQIALETLFPANPNSAQNVRKALGDPIRLENVLTGSARMLVDQRNVGEVVEVLGSLGKIPGQHSKMLAWYDGLNGLMKRYMIFSPGFHIRNTFGGEFNNFLAGVDASSRRDWMRIWAKSKGGTAPERLSAAQKKIFDQVEATGILHQTQAADVAGSTSRQAGRSWNPVRENFAPIKASKFTSEQVEGYLRGSLAYDVLKKGGNVDDAADAVIKFHFDYDDLSGFERGVMKRIIPFYTFTRKNLPLQLEQMAKQPRKYMAYLHAKDNIESFSEEESLVPGFYGDLGAIRMPWKLGEGQAYWAPDLPFRDVSEFIRPDEPLRGVGMAIGAATPIIKLPVERWAGKKYFTDQPFYPGHSKAPGSWALMPGVMPALRAAGLAEKGADGSYYMDQRNVYSVEQIIPVLARIHRLAPAGEGDEYMKQRQASNWLSFFGLGVQSNTPEAQKAEQKRRTKALNAAKKKAQDLGYFE